MFKIYIYFFVLQILDETQMLKIVNRLSRVVLILKVGYFLYMHSMPYLTFQNVFFNIIYRTFAGNSKIKTTLEPTFSCYK